MLKKKVIVDIDKLKNIRNYLLDIDRTDYNGIVDGIEDVAYEIGSIILNNERI